ncbi:hypothetical protein BKA93DRAFT_787012 [Sparassis latifolia]
MSLQDTVWPTLEVNTDINPVLDRVLKSVIIWAPQSNGVTHWRTSYEFAEVVRKGPLGISVDMFQPKSHVYHTTKGTGNSFGTLLIKVSFEKLTSTSPAVRVDIPLQQAVTVRRQLLEFIVTRNMQYYRFHNAGSGCMFWQLTLLQRMGEEAKWIRVEEFLRVLNIIQEARNASSAVASSMPWPPRQGTFYTPPTSQAA